MDMNKRDEFIEKTNHLQKTLKESYATMQAKQFSLFKENAKAVGDKLKKSVGIKPLKEDAQVPPVPTDDADVPAPVDVNAPEAGIEGGETESQDQFATKEFVKTFLKGLPTEIDLEGAVDASGIFKVEVDENGAVAGASPEMGVEGGEAAPAEEPLKEETDVPSNTFTVLVFPSSKSIREVADTLEPVAPEAGDVPPSEGGEAAPRPEGSADELKEQLTEGRKPKDAGKVSGKDFISKQVGELEKKLRGKQKEIQQILEDLKDPSTTPEEVDAELERVKTLKSELNVLTTALKTTSAQFANVVSDTTGLEDEPEEVGEVEASEKPELPVSDVPLDDTETAPEVDEDEAGEVEAKKEQERDPMMEGRKNWKSYVRTLLNESKKK